MYRYQEMDSRLVFERVEQYREQTARYLRGDLTDEEFRPLRLMNGLYIQAHAPMLRIAIPYGLLSAAQLRGLADICDRFDRGFGHFTTRQNLQLNWPKLEEVPDLLEALARIQLHAIQTSGNCIRNVTTDELAGVAADEVEDPRPWCELLRQWSTFHPEFSFLPRKFKIAVTASAHDRAATQVHDIGLWLQRDAAGETVVDVLVGGGLGRTPVIGTCIRPGLQASEVLRYVEAIMRVYNLHGRRDNKFKARIKILVNALGAEEFAAQVEAEYQRVCQDTPPVSEDAWQQLRQEFAPPPRDALEDLDMGGLERQVVAGGGSDLAFSLWHKRNTRMHRSPGYRAVYLSLKPLGGVPGDLDSEAMRAVADLSERFGHGELRTTHTQNLVLPDVRQQDLPQLWRALQHLGLARPNIGMASDIICCPGLDYCGLANAGTIGVTQEMDARLEALDFAEDLGELKIKISGCMNACGHHHVGNIGILGVEKKGEEWYQIQLGGSAEEDASLGRVLGPAVPKEQLAQTMETLARTYVQLREDQGESFLACVRRLGAAPFKQAVYG